jgi:hypothetical protein
MDLFYIMHALYSETGLGLNLGFHGKRSVAVTAMPDLTLETNDEGYPLPAPTLAGLH